MKNYEKNKWYSHAMKYYGAIEIINQHYTVTAD